MKTEQRVAPRWHDRGDRCHVSLLDVALLTSSNTLTSRPDRISPSGKSPSAEQQGKHRVGQGLAHDGPQAGLLVGKQRIGAVLLQILGGLSRSQGRRSRSITRRRPPGNFSSIILAPSPYGYCAKNNQNNSTSQAPGVVWRTHSGSADGECQTQCHNHQQAQTKKKHPVSPALITPAADHGAHGGK